MDASFVYWGGADSSGGAIHRVAKTGGAAETVVSGLSYTLTSIVTDGVLVYFSMTGNAPNVGSISSVPVGADGGVSATLLYGAQNAPSHVAIDSKNVYWTNDTFGSPGSTNQAPIGGGGTITPLSSNQPSSGGIAVDGKNVYWTLITGAVNKTPIGGGAIVPLTTTAIQPYDLVVNATTAYFATYDTDGGTRIASVPLAGGATSSLLNGPMPGYMALDSTSIYFSEGFSPNNTVNAVSLDAGQRTILATAQARAAGVVVDAVAVYWVNIASGAVMKVAK